MNRKLLIASILLAAPCCLYSQTVTPQSDRGLKDPPPAKPFSGDRPQAIANGKQLEEPNAGDVVAMLDALPEHSIAQPKRPRRILVLANAEGWVHSSIPLAAKTVEELGKKTGAWSTTITYNPVDITPQNLAYFDCIFLDQTTGAFLDDKNDASATAARRQALLDFVRSGKGLAGIHAAGDSYHARVDAHNPATLIGTWPEFNKMIGGFFKFHWLYPQMITVKIDDPKSPLTAMFRGKEFTIHDEIYTFAQDSFSRKNVHVLTSLDYSKMSDSDKAKEPVPTRRTDGDYALSWIRHEGQGRVYYEALGHNEHVYAIPLYLQHLLAGIQYALGDLQADDKPSAGN